MDCRQRPAGLDILKDTLMTYPYSPGIGMPVMDDTPFLDTIKSDEELSLIPVIVMTSPAIQRREKWTPL